MSSLPTVRASTGPRAKKSEVFNKMTTVRGITGADMLKQAMAASMAAVSPGAKMMENINAKLQQRQKKEKAGKTYGFFNPSKK